MIRIDFMENGNFVNTTWIKEDGDKHSQMGRLIFTKEDFDHLVDEVMADERGGQTLGYRFERKQ